MVKDGHRVMAAGITLALAVGLLGSAPVMARVTRCRLQLDSTPTTGHERMD